MHTRRFAVKWAVSGIALQLGFLPMPAVRAQDAPPVKKARVIIHTPDGEQVIDLDPDTLPDLGEGNHVVMKFVGPDGKITTFNGEPGMLGMLKGPGGSAFLGSGGMKLNGMDVIDPGRNYALQLLKREDVQAQLFLSPRQKEALDALDKNQQQAMQEQMKPSVVGLAGDIKGKSPEELKTYFAERATRMRDQLQSLESERDKKITTILTPAQSGRLKELDLQWRGPLAMGVKDVAEQAKLTPSQAPVVTDLLKEYRQEVSKRLNMSFRSFAASAKTGNGTNPDVKGSSSLMPSSPAEMQANLEKAARDIEKSRKLLGDRALKSLSDDQRAQWANLTRKPFVFRN